MADFGYALSGEEHGARELEAAGYDHVYLHQIRPDQDGFFDLWERELRPQLS